jgi:hypothetical protein
VSVVLFANSDMIHLPPAFERVTDCRDSASRYEEVVQMRPGPVSRQKTSRKAATLQTTSSLSYPDGQGWQFTPRLRLKEHAMRISNAFFISATFCSLSLVAAAQSATGGTPVQAPPSAQPAPSGLLQPALDQVQQAVSALKVDKWKKGTVRDEAGPHVSAILKDLQTTLPPLLSTANAAPGTTSKMLPVSRNLSALYDVLLSVAEAARIASSPEELTQLEQALASLGTARAALDDRLQSSVAALEKQEVDLRTSLQASQATQRAAATPPPAPVCPAPAPVRKAKRAVKPPAKPTQPSTAPANPTPKPQN